jgi:hypothetical protein
VAHVHRLALVGERRVAGDHEQPAAAREGSDDVVRHSAGEILLFGIAAHVLGRQHRDQRAVEEGGNRHRLFRGDGDSCGWSRRGLTLLPHRAHEANALALQRLDQPLLFTAVADGSTRRVSAVGESRFGDDATSPDRSDHVVLADHAIAVADQIDQEVENLGLKRNEIAPAVQLAPISIEREILKSEE